MKNGFTLIELLLVICITAVLSVSTVIMFKEVQEGNSQNSLKDKYVDIQRTAKVYMDLNDNKSESFNELGYAYVSIEELVSKGFINDINNYDISEEDIVKITILNNGSIRYVDTCILDNSKSCIADSDGYFKEIKEDVKCCQ